MLMVIDGNNLAYRMFHTPQGSLTTRQGEPSGVIFGTMIAMKSLLEKFPETTRVIIAWDGGKAKWRKEMYPEYKANRSYGATEEEKARFDALFAQIEALNDFLPNLGINSIKMKGHEADDIIAVICDHYLMADDQDNVMVVTTDKDMLQLINDRVSVYSPIKDRIVSPLNFYEHTGVTKNAYLGYRALLGDDSDNISGVNGIGDKTAKSLMDTYGHIDNILSATGANKDALMKSKRTSKIFDKANLDILARNNKIMNFKFIPTDVDMNSLVEEAIGYDSDGYRIPSLTVNNKVVKEFCTRWQFVHILAQYLAWVVPFMGLGDDEPFPSLDADE